MYCSLAFLSFASGRVEMLPIKFFSLIQLFQEKYQIPEHLCFGGTDCKSDFPSDFYSGSCCQCECYWYEFTLGFEASLNWVPLWISLPFAKERKKKSQLFHFSPMAIFYLGFPFLFESIQIFYVFTRKFFISYSFKHLLALCCKYIPYFK